jgi:hypothetical protein
MIKELQVIYIYLLPVHWVIALNTKFTWQEKKQ